MRDNKQNTNPTKVNFILLDDKKQAVQKGVLQIRPTRFGYETRFEKSIEILAGDQLLIDWEFDI